MSVEYKYSKEACFVARKLLKTTQYVSKFIKTYHQTKHNLTVPTGRLNQINYQLNNTVKLTAEMCMSKHPMYNSTHVGETNNAAVINNWAVVATHTDEYGAIHHSASSSMYIFAVLLMVALFLALFIWCCKGAVWKWFTNLFKKSQNQPQQQQTIGLQNIPQILPQHLVNMAQGANRTGSGYFQRTLPLVPEIQ